MFRKLLICLHRAVRCSAPGRADGREKRRMAFVCGRAGKHEILAARSNQQRQRQEPADCLAVQDRQPRAAPRFQHAVGAHRRQQRDVRAGRHAPLGRGARSRQRRDAVDVAHGRGQTRRGSAAPGLGPRARVLDRRQGRRAHRHRHARLSHGAAQREDRRSGRRRSAETAWSISRRRSISPASISRPPTSASTRRPRSATTSSSSEPHICPAARRAPKRTSRATFAATTCAPASACGFSTRFPSRASSATTRGRTIRGRIRATPATGRPSPSTKSSTACISQPKMRLATTSAAIAPATICFPHSVVCLDLNTGKRLLVFPGDPSRHLGLGFPGRRRS